MSLSERSWKWLLGGTAAGLMAFGAICGANAITTETESRNEPIHFETRTVYDDKKYTDYLEVQREGTNGEKVVTYTVSYKDGKEVGRVKQSEEIITPAQEEVVVKGTKVYYTCSDGTRHDSLSGKNECENKISWAKQRDAALAECNADSSKTHCWYDEYPGTTIHWQEPSRVGAICRDGRRSYATGRGACSHHGGVSYWLYD